MIKFFCDVCEEEVTNKNVVSTGRKDKFFNLNTEGGVFEIRIFVNGKEGLPNEVCNKCFAEMNQCITRQLQEEKF